MIESRADKLYNRHELTRNECLLLRRFQQHLYVTVYVHLWQLLGPKYRQFSLHQLHLHNAVVAHVLRVT